jgi:hypothetical protein
LVVSLLTLAGAPIASAENAVVPAAKPGPLTAAAAASGAALGTQLAARPAISPQAAPQAAGSDSKPFLKSTKGVVAVLAFVGAAAFTGWSLSHDRIKSPAR